MNLKARYDRDGWARLDGMLAHLPLARWCDEIEALPERPGGVMVYGEDSVSDSGARILSRIENFVPHHAGLRELATRGALLETASRFLGEPAVLFKDKINFKMPGGGAFKAHQDMAAGWAQYASRFISIMATVDAADEENGCLEIATGSWDNLISDEWTPLEDDGSLTYAPVVVAPGDVVVFDGLTPHRSAPNLRGPRRRAIFLTYNLATAGDQRAVYYADKRASYPPDRERNPSLTYVYRV